MGPIDMILMLLNVQCIGLCGSLSTHETYCVEHMYATTCVSFLEKSTTKKYLYTIHTNDFVRKTFNWRRVCCLYCF